MTEAKKTYRTFSEVMLMPAGESEPIIMRAAPAISRLIEGVGLLDIFMSDDFATYQSATKMAKLPKKEQERIKAKMLESGKTLTKQLLEKGLGDNLPDLKEILAAINDVTLEELNSGYNTLEIISMGRALLGDKGFLSLLRTSAPAAGQG